MKTFADFLIESSTDALVRLKALPGNTTIEANQIFNDIDNPPNGIEMYGAHEAQHRSGDYHFGQQVVATQDGIIRKDVEHWIRTPINQWHLNDKYDSIVVVQQGPVWYVIDGHHRLAAAILLQLNTLRVDIVK